MRAFVIVVIIGTAATVLPSMLFLTAACRESPDHELYSHATSGAFTTPPLHTGKTEPVNFEFTNTMKTTKTSEF